jgi:hypothetical protein
VTNIKFAIDSHVCDIHQYKKIKVFNCNVNIFFNIQGIKSYLIPKYVTIEAASTSAAASYITKKEPSNPTSRNNIRLNLINRQTKTGLKTK